MQMSYAMQYMVSITYIRHLVSIGKYDRSIIIWQLSPKEPLVP